MPAEPMDLDDSAAGSRTRTGPRHAAPKKPLFTRLHVPTGKAIALAAMPTAVLMGMGFTPTLALADDPTSSKSLTADEYKDCVAALQGEDGEKTTATPSPSASASESASEDESEDATSGSSDSGSTSSDSGSDDKDDDTAEPTPTDTATQDTSTADDASTDTSSSSSKTTEESGGNVLDDIGSALEDLFTPDDTDVTSDDAASPSATPSPSASEDETDTVGDVKEEAEKDAKAATTDDDTAKDTAEKAKKDVDTASSSPSPSPSETKLPKSCVAATDDESGVEKGIPLLADDPWILEASSLTLKGADYKGIVKVKTADGTVKEVLKYVVSSGTDIDDLHQTVDDPAAGVRYHVKGGKGTTSKITGGKTVMYTESISGNLLGLIPVTFDPKHPPPVNIPLIYFTKVKVIQAAQFGGTLQVPGMQQSITPLG